MELNRTVAVAMHDGPAAGLALLDAILEGGDLADYHLAHSARAELYRRLGKLTEARSSYEAPSRLRDRNPSGGFLSVAWNPWPEYWPEPAWRWISSGPIQRGAILQSSPLASSVTT